MNKSSQESNNEQLDWGVIARTLDWTPARRERRLEDWMLLASTANWIKALPTGVKPIYLHKRFPRIANELHRRWADHAELSEYFDDLLQDTRGYRQGFPPLIYEELKALHAYAKSTHSGGPGSAEK